MSDPTAHRGSLGGEPAREPTDPRGASPPTNPPGQRTGLGTKLDAEAMDHLRTLVVHRDENGAVVLYPDECSICERIAKWAVGWPKLTAPEGEPK